MSERGLSDVVSLLLRAYQEDSNKKFSYQDACIELIEAYLQQRPRDIPWHLKLALAYDLSSYPDHKKSYDVLTRPITKRRFGFDALLMAAYFEYYAKDEPAAVCKLVEKLEPQTCCEKAMRYVALSRFYAYAEEKNDQWYWRQAFETCPHNMLSLYLYADYNQGSLESWQCYSKILHFINQNGELINKQYDDAGISVDAFFDREYRGYCFASYQLAAIKKEIYGKADQPVATLYPVPCDSLDLKKDCSYEGDGRWTIVELYGGVAIGEEVYVHPLVGSKKDEDFFVMQHIVFKKDTHGRYDSIGAQFQNNLLVLHLMFGGHGAQLEYLMKRIKNIRKFGDISCYESMMVYYEKDNLIEVREDMCLDGEGLYQSLLVRPNDLVSIIERWIRALRQEKEFILMTLDDNHYVDFVPFDTKHEIDMHQVVQDGVIMIQGEQ